MGQVNQGTLGKTMRCPWRWLGVSKSTFLDLVKAGRAPKPLPLPGHPRWDRETLQLWLDTMKQEARR
jgi:predicted DNA-binding transcriptional regulator AlpA